jgi:hypothetical protein
MNFDRFHRAEASSAHIEWSEPLSEARYAQGRTRVKRFREPRILAATLGVASHRTRQVDDRFNIRPAPVAWRPSQSVMQAGAERPVLYLACRRLTLPRREGLVP